MSFANISGEGHPALLQVSLRQTVARDYRSSEGAKKPSRQKLLQMLTSLIVIACLSFCVPATIFTIRHEGESLQ